MIKITRSLVHKQYCPASLACLPSRDGKFSRQRFLSTSSRLGLSFTQQHDELRATTRKIIEKEVNPFVDQWEREGMFDAHKVFKQLGEAGLLGITRSPDYGGLGLDYSFSIAFFEELSYRLDATGVLGGIQVQSDMALPALVRFGSDELKRKFLVPSITGEFVACVGVTEPAGGSDVAAIRTTAKREGDDYVINGEKIWITNGFQADWMCLLANTSHGQPHRNKSLFCLPLNTPGVHVARKLGKLGMWCSDTAHIFFENVRLPASHMIGEAGQGFIYQMKQFQEERLSMASAVVGRMQRIIDETIDYCRQRSTFGKPLIENQVIHFRLAELQAEIELLKSLVYRSADALIAGEDVTFLASVAKLKSGRLAREVCDSCLQFWGGMGYSDETIVSRTFRDMRLYSIGGGSDEIILGILAKYMDIAPKKKSK